MLLASSETTTDLIVDIFGGKGSPHYIAGQNAARAGEPWPQMPGRDTPIRDHLFWLGYKNVEEAADAN